MYSWTEDYQLLMFDFDGLLVNSEPIFLQAYTTLLQTKGFHLDWDLWTYGQYAHGNVSFIREKILEKFPALQRQYSNWQIFRQELKEIYLHLFKTEKLFLMPGVEKLLLHIKERNVRHCVVTNSFDESISIICDRLPILHQIPYWVTRKDYVNPKPSSESYEVAIKRYAKKNTRIIGFEDTKRGITALMQTPAQAVLICSDNHPQLKDMPTGVFHFSSFEEITKEGLS